MATKIYDSDIIYLIDGTKIEIYPLKIKYLRRFMNSFNKVRLSDNDYESIEHLLECAIIAMEQYYPKIKTIKDLEEKIDLPTIKKLVAIAGSIKTSESSNNQATSRKEEQGDTWEDLDLAKLEAEVFLLGIWKDYKELEESLSMPELISTLSSKRELDYQEKKFLAAIQGIDLDKENGRGQKEWEDLKARVYSRGRATDSNDIMALQGQGAIQAGFGIGMGIDYEDLR